MLVSLADRHLIRWLTHLAGPVLLAAILPLAACGAPQQGSTSTCKTTNATPVTIGLTYFPDVQFAPFYVAAAKGFYSCAGLNVTLHHGIENNEFALLATGHEDAIFAGGDEALEARATSGLALVDVATVFQKYPVALIAPANSPIHTAADLSGHTIGVPGHFGATYTGLLALLHSAGLTAAQVHIQDIGFTQIAALVSHRVDAVMGYSNNEALQLQRQGFAIRTLDVWKAQPLVSNGLVVLNSELQQHPDVVRALVSATLRGVQYTIDHPAEAVTISKSYVSNLSQPDQATQALAVLQASIPLWQGGGKLGYNDPTTWQTMTTFLRSVGLLTTAIDQSQAYTNQFLPA
jgi:NitT/TauT family transport system substrate-binding protein